MTEMALPMSGHEKDAGFGALSPSPTLLLPFSPSPFPSPSPSLTKHSSLELWATIYEFDYPEATMSYVRKPSHMERPINKRAFRWFHCWHWFTSSHWVFLAAAQTLWSRNELSPRCPAQSSAPQNLWVWLNGYFKPLTFLPFHNSFIIVKYT